jgi:hypothetical protein
LKSVTWLLLGGALVAIVIAPPAGAAVRGAPASPGLQAVRLALWSGDESNLASSLQKVATAQRAGGTDAGVTRAKALGLPVSGSFVRVIVVADSGRLEQARFAVTAAGGSVEVTAGTLVQALLPPSALSSVAAVNGVSLVRPPARPFSLAVTGEEIAASHAAAFTGAGLDGTGVKVAVVDLGFNGYAAKLGTELPASVTAVDDCSGGLATGTDHGTAVAEIVHEVAPGAQLYLICVDTEVQLAAAEAYAKANGIRIINHSVAWFNSGRGDGTAAFAGSPDATVADARANGILWINAAGNQALSHWSGTFVDDGGGFNVFNGSSSLEQTVIVGGQQACFALKWDAWPTTTIDYDLGIYSLSGAPTLVASSVNDQAGGNLPPTEEACYTNPGVTAAFGIGIYKFSAGSSPRLDLFSINTGSLQFQTAAGSIIEPASSPNAMAVGAVCWNGFGLQPYSSQGPTIDGRTKPDISGYDAVSSSVYGAASGCGNGFTGTSAAAPNVAGIAALFLQQMPGLTPAQLQTNLEAQVADLGAVGKDNSFGAGRIVLADLLAPANSGLPSISGTLETGSVVTASPGTWTGSPAAMYTYQWERCDSSGASCIDIGSATASTYALVGADGGMTIRVRVTASNGVPPAATAESAATGLITVPTPTPGGGGGGGGGSSAAADLYLTGSAQPVSVAVGGTLTWRLRVLDDKNYGSATGVYVDVELPTGVALASALADRGPGCAPAGARKLRCSLDWLSSDAPYGNVTLVSNVTAPGELVLTATAGNSRADTNPADNSLVLKANTPATAAPLPVVKPPAMKPVFGKALRSPLAPAAGKRFTFILPVTRSDTGKALNIATMVGKPLLAGKAIKHSTSFGKGKARLSLLLPENAKNKQLRLKITISAAGQTTTRTFVYKVR